MADITQIALLRGINVGRAKRVAMAELREMFMQLGYVDVKTLLNSGNVVFRGPKADAAALEQAFAKRFGFSSRFAVITAADLAKAAQENTLGNTADNDSRLLAVFVNEPSILKKLAPLQKEKCPPEVLLVGKRAAYVWCPNGILESELLTAVGRILGDAATTRNWATVTKLLAMVAGSR